MMLVGWRDNALGGMRAVFNISLNSGDILELNTQAHCSTLPCSVFAFVFEVFFAASKLTTSSVETFFELPRKTPPF